MKIPLPTILLLLTSAALARSSAQVVQEVLSGLPTVKYEVTVNESQRTKLSSASSIENAVRIVKVGEDYLWSTRQNRKLIYQYSGFGDFHYFIDPRGGGYVKIAKTPDGKVTFSEHTGLGMVFITYFGSAQSFTP